MTRKLQEQLYEKYPEIFADRTKPMTETAMCWGIECDDGWYDLIDELCKKIMVAYVEDDIEIPVASQVKEKYGSLCFYVTGGNDAVYDLIRNAEKMSEKTCEICGNKGLQFINNRGWMKTLCAAHAVELEYVID